MSRAPVRFGVAGLGGYAGYISDRLLTEGNACLSHARLVAVCDPELDRFPERISELQNQGVAVVSTLDDLLAHDIEAVSLPVPIDLHRPFTEAALCAGKAVLCEKPAAGSVDDVDAMIAARGATRLPVGIGFQDVYQPGVHELKRRILRGDFGVVLSASVCGCWPRGDRYYRRNTWAGRIKRNGRWVLDSPANNALAHYVHLALFLLGPTENTSAVPDEVEAELYRANPIENYDTCSLRLTFDGGSHALIGLTHACATNMEPDVLIRTEHARIRYSPARRIEIATPSVTETIKLLRNPHSAMFETMQKWLRDGSESAAGGTLEMARAHTVAINAASQAAAVVDIPAEFIEPALDERGAPLRTVRGLVAALKGSISEGRMLHESGLVPWSVPARDMDTRAYRHFDGPATIDSLPVPRRIASDQAVPL
jgi:predicted dehydrogenase